MPQTFVPPHPKRSDAAPAPRTSEPAAKAAPPRGARPPPGPPGLPGLVPSPGGVVRSVAPPPATFGPGMVTPTRSVGPIAPASGSTVQRLKKNAEKYVKHHADLGLKKDDLVSASSIRALIESVDPSVGDKTAPGGGKRRRSLSLTEDRKRLYRGLIDAWNVGQKPNQLIAVPEFLKPEVVKAAKVDLTGDTWKPLEKFAFTEGADETDWKRWREFRREGSVDLSTRLEELEAPEKDGSTGTKRVKLNEYPEKTIYMDLGGYKATSARSSNFVTGGNMSGVGGSEYKNLLAAEERIVTDPKTLAKIHLDGLFDADEYQNSIAPYDDNQKKLFNFTTCLFVNEILGRSRSNLVDVTAPLMKTHKDGSKMSDNLFASGLYLPNKGADKGNVGGSELSKIGRDSNKLEHDALSSSNQELVNKNRRMYHSLMDTAGSPDNLKKNIEELNERFKLNMPKYNFSFK